IRGNDAFFEAGCFERGLSLENRPANPGLEPFRRGGIDVVGDRLLRVAEVSGLPIAALETVARDVAALRRSLLGRTEIHLAHAEEAYALVEAARRHRIRRETHDAPVREHAGRWPLCGRCSTATTPTGGAGGRCQRSRLRRFDFNVVGEGERAFDER